MKPLENRRILLVGIGFYDYETVIADEFRRLGAQVQVEDQRPLAERGRLGPIRRAVFGAASADQIARHHAAILRRSRSFGPLDYVLVIKGELLGAPFLQSLRDLHPSARFISYQWDSMARFPDLVDRQTLFDRVLTFDQADAAKYTGFILRPTFFRPELVSARAVAPLDLCFVGWLHHDRLRQVEALRAQATTLGRSAYFYLFTGVRTGLEMWLKGRGQDVHVRTLSFSRYAQHVAASRVIIDLPHPLQTGLTMRAAEAVGTGKKLLTTATGVRAYDFFRPENVAIIDPDNPQLPPRFLDTPPVPLRSDLVDRYTIRAWALDVLGLTEPAGFVAATDRAEGTRQRWP